MSLALYTVLLLTCTLWDLFTTWLVTPDLELELNPLFRALGGAWPALLVQQIVLTLFVIWLVRNCLTVKTSYHPIQSNLSIRYFVLGLFFKQPEGWRRLLFHMPDRPGAFIYVIGSIAFFAVPLGHLQAGFSNWLIIQSDSYGTWFDDHLPWSWLGGCFGTASIAIGAFLVRDYITYRHTSSEPSLVPLRK
jgi:hypothetical protein